MLPGRERVALPACPTGRPPRPDLQQTLRERERRGPSGQLAAELLTDMEALLGEGAALLGEYRRVSAGAERSARAAGSAAPPSEDSAEAWVAAAVADPGPGQADPPVFGQPSVAYPLPPPCSLLAPGVSFEGVQQVATLAGRRKTEGQWKVGVTLHSYDPGSGSIAGSMSSSLPNEAVPVSTFFEGEVGAGLCEGGREAALGGVQPGQGRASRIRLLRVGQLGQGRARYPESAFFGWCSQGRAGHPESR